MGEEFPGYAEAHARFPLLREQRPDFPCGQPAFPQFMQLSARLARKAWARRSHLTPIQDLEPEHKTPRPTPGSCCPTTETRPVLWGLDPQQRLTFHTLSNPPTPSTPSPSFSQLMVVTFLVEW